MNTDDARLRTALDELTPTAVEPRTWDDVLRRAEHRRKLSWVVRRLAPAVGLAAATAMLAVLFVRFANPDEGARPAASPVRFAIFERAQTTAERNLDLAGRSELDLTTVRIAQTVGDTTYLVAKTEDGRLCILEGPPAGSTACGTEATIAQSGAITLDTPGERDRAGTFTGLVPDAVIRARAGDAEVSVTGNVYVLPAPPGSGPVELLAPAGWQPVGRPLAVQPPPVTPTSMPDGFTALFERPQTDLDRTSGIGGDFDNAPGIDPRTVRFLGNGGAAGEPGFFVGARVDGSLCLIDAAAKLTACPGPDHPPSGLAGWKISRSDQGGGGLVAGLAPPTFQIARQFGEPSRQVPIANGLYVVRVTPGAPRIVEIALDENATWTHVSGPSEFGNLQRRQGAQDALPADLAAIRIDADPSLRPNPASIRYAGVFHGEGAWVSGDGLGLCLHVTPDQAHCGGEDAISLGAYVFDPAPGGYPTNQGPHNWTRDLAGIADDRYSAARVGDVTAPVVNNVFVFSGRPRGDRLVLTGQGGTLAIDLRVDGG